MILPRGRQGLCNIEHPLKNFSFLIVRGRLNCPQGVEVGGEPCRKERAFKSIRDVSGLFFLCAGEAASLSLLDKGRDQEKVENSAVLTGAQNMRLVPAVEKRSSFDPRAFLSTVDVGKQIVAFSERQMIFVQGDSSDAVYYIHQGRVKVTVVAASGKEATIALLKEHDFVGESCLAGEHFRMCSATAMTECSAMRIDKKSMKKALQQEHSLSHLFMAYLLRRNARYEEDLIDQLFNSSEKRLARMLLILAHFGKEGARKTVAPRISQETLAEMVGTTRGRVSFFMNRFRALGLIDYNHAGLQVHTALLTVVLRD
jgi:CRP/FNR family transcriptional regulator, cyclic AMP receptor protein